MKYGKMGNCNRCTFLLLLFVLGCASKAIPESVLVSAQNKYAQVESLIAVKDYTTAIPLLDELITGGGLNPDFAVNCFLMRSKCYLEQGNLAEALKDIEMVASGAGDMSVVHGLRYIYWTKMGDPAKAQTELRLAQQMNPQFKLP